jgi:DNA-3-methyladenine glycosylase I
MSDGVVVGEDGRSRCAWGGSSAEYRAYHDDEWGRPVGDEIRIYEKLCLEGFQAGLSWITILRKRPAFRRAFAGFDPTRVAAFGPGEVEALLTDAGIVRHRGKIEAAITNARAVLDLHRRGRSLAGLVWSHRPAAEQVPAASGALEASTAESKALSRELRKNGLVFVGPTTVYSAMQSLGVVNDHLPGCEWREVCEEERRRFEVPPVIGGPRFGDVS